MIKKVTIRIEALSNQCDDIELAGVSLKYQGFTIPISFKHQKVEKDVIKNITTFTVTGSDPVENWEIIDEFPVMVAKENELSSFDVSKSDEWSVFISSNSDVYMQMCFIIIEDLQGNIALVDNLDYEPKINENLPELQLA